MNNVAHEANFDGLPGPTHNYSGLSTGNLASTTHKNLVSNPKEAALQGLQKMKFLSDLGVPQGVIPPHERPAVYVLRSMGFAGSDQDVLSKALKEVPHILSSVCSASAMWTANAATVSPSADSQDGRVHFTPANLSNKFHRSIEPETTAKILKAIFKNSGHFVHHPALPAGEYLSDEGAANHTRLCSDYGSPGLELFVYGRRALEDGYPRPKIFPARQTLEASASIARTHLLNHENVMLVQQNPDAIDAGIFHNDVISVGNKNVFFYHEEAFVDQDAVLAQMDEKFERLTSDELIRINVSAEQLRVKDVVDSYLFNSQLISLSDNKMLLLVPQECQENDRVKGYLTELVQSAQTPISQFQSFDLRQSMRNGGGPACLRLRVALTKEERAAANQNVFMSDKLYMRLCAWVNKHYRDRMSFSELADSQLLNEVRTALDELTGILALGSIYPFQLL